MITVDFFRKILYDNIIIIPTRAAISPGNGGFPKTPRSVGTILFILCRITGSFSAFSFLQSEAS